MELHTFMWSQMLTTFRKFQNFTYKKIFFIILDSEYDEFNPRLSCINDPCTL